MKTEFGEVPEVIQEALLSYPNVTGVGIGADQRDGKIDEETEAIIVFVTEKVDESNLTTDDLVPTEVEVKGRTVPTDIQESGEVHAHELNRTVTDTPFTSSRKDRWRPVPAGVSVGHPDHTAGTLGTPPLRTQRGNIVFLTSSHVAAKSGDADVGDIVLQPGRFDGGTPPKDNIGTLFEFTTVSTETSNTTDSALVEVEPDVIQGGILDIAEVLQGFSDAEIGLAHHKSGRTTGVTSGHCTARHATFKVTYDHGLARFSDVDVFDAMAAGGDSGSLIGVEQADGFYGTSLLFAGSSRITLGIPMANVLAEHGELTPETPPNQVDYDSLRGEGTPYRNQIIQVSVMPIYRAVVGTGIAIGVLAILAGILNGNLLAIGVFALATTFLVYAYRQGVQREY